MDNGGRVRSKGRPHQHMNLVLLSRDLMLAARVEGAARQSGLTVVTAADESAAIAAAKDANCRIVLVDLRHPGLQVSPLVKALRRSDSQQLPIVACGPHVHEVRLEEARAAGCDEVVTRGQFDREAESILLRLLKH